MSEIYERWRLPRSLNTGEIVGRLLQLRDPFPVPMGLSGIVLTTANRKLISYWSNPDYFNKVGPRWQPINEWTGPRSAFMPTGEDWGIRSKGAKDAYRNDLFGQWQGEPIAEITKALNIPSDGMVDNLYSKVKALALQIAADLLYGVKIEMAQAERIASAYGTLNAYNARNSLTGGLLDRLRCPPTNFDAFAAFKEDELPRASASPFDWLHGDFTESLKAIWNFGRMLVQQSKQSAIAEKMRNAGLSEDDQIREATVQIGGAHGAPGALISSVLTCLAMPENIQYQRMLRSQPDLLPSVIQETLRLYPPFWVQLRHCVSNVNLPGISIGAGTDVLFCTYVADRDPKIYGPKADRFMPERFASNPILRKHLTSFGFGQRRCPAGHIGVEIARLVVQEIVEKYSFEAVGTPRFTFGDTLHPSDTNRMLFIARS
ncbi:MAG: cytochrome P450 [Patescibacteria group bacterium]|nr:cytochrome P450 [Patescibacteria group bacterium]